KKLAIAAPVLNAACPMSFPYGSLQRIYLEEDTLCTLVKVGSKVPDVSVFKDHESELMLAMLILLAEDSTYTQVTDIMRDMSKYGVWFRMRIDNTPTKGGGMTSVRLYAPPSMLDSVFSGRLSEREQALAKVRVQILLTQLQLPYTVNSSMTMTAISYAEGEVLMDYTIKEDSQINLGREAFRTTAQLFIRQRIWNELIRSKNETTQEVIKLYYLSGSRLRYTCTGETSGGQVQVLLTQGDLRMLLSHYGLHL
ncbi:MAG: hypothetical protein J5635_01285, partial [Paludibacteraceae bacterium]|nr:hypothetical protein [Paludibacteraceae bacterium]